MPNWDRDEGCPYCETIGPGPRCPIHDTPAPPEPIEAPTAPINSRCFCGGKFQEVKRDATRQYFECVRCQLPVDRRIA